MKDRLRREREDRDVAERFLRDEVDDLRSSLAASEAPRVCVARVRDLWRCRTRRSMSSWRALETLCIVVFRSFREGRSCHLSGVGFYLNCVLRRGSLFFYV